MIGKIAFASALLLELHFYFVSHTISIFFPKSIKADGNGLLLQQVNHFKIGLESLRACRL